MNYYYYFSIHTIYPQNYTRLAANTTSQKFDLETKDLLDKFLENFTKLNNEQISPLDYCSRFIMKHKDELYELDKLTDSTPKEFLLNFLGTGSNGKRVQDHLGKTVNSKRMKFQNKN
jgi:hypothetical protein